MHTNLYASLTLLTLSGLATAQNTIVSPVQATSTEGNTNNAFPWNSATVRRYQQIHSDVGGSPKAITRLSFRQNAGTTTNYLGVWAADVEVSMGHSRPWNDPSLVFAQNYIGAPVLVVTRKVLNLGPVGQNAVAGPLPFTIHVPFDVPFNYTGATSLVWDALVYANTLSGGTFNQLDAEGASSTSATQTIIGTGCIATGRTVAMTHTVIANDPAGPLLFGGYAVANGPSSAPVLIAIGASNPNLTVPGLCSNLYTDLVLLFPIGVTSATGALAADHGNAFIFPVNTFAGLPLFTQALALDAARPDPIAVSNSNGRQIVLPTTNSTNVVMADRIYNNVGGTTATTAAVIGTSLGYAIVTQFTY